MKSVKIVLPAYNEEKSLPSLLRKISAVAIHDVYRIEVLVVNDGSTDQTAQVALEAASSNVALLNLIPNRGLAGAIREGLKEALTNMEAEDIVVTMDADDSHDPLLILKMVEEVNRGADIVIASRYRKGSKIIGLSNYRKMLSFVAGGLFRVVFAVKGVRDYTCGYRAYKVSLLKKAQRHYEEKLIEQKGFACMAEILVKMKLFHPIIVEVPFILRYDQKKSASKMNILKTIRQTLYLLFKGI
ncbi:MAG TPA: glycosyltransferase family 2 protein [Cytophagaceae bacterium]|jgi:dolichol-phosphate mannosyltransferase|nr:glycosyltransferase family 2 protein [Cytophagaceae bacterium]